MGTVNISFYFVVKQKVKAELIYCKFKKNIYVHFNAEIIALFTQEKMRLLMSKNKKSDKGMSTANLYVLNRNIAAFELVCTKLKPYMRVLNSLLESTSRIIFICRLCLP